MKLLERLKMYEPIFQHYHVIDILQEYQDMAWVLIRDIYNHEDALLKVKTIQCDQRDIDMEVARLLSLYEITDFQHLSDACYSMIEHYYEDGILDILLLSKVSELELDVMVYDVEDIFNLACDFLNGTSECVQDEYKAFELFMLALNKGSIPAITTVGYLTEVGLGTSRDEAKAVSYYQQAASKNDKVGLNNLGNCYYFGIGDEIDYIKAFECYKKLLDLGGQAAHYYLAECYAQGNGTDKDEDLAFYHYLQAAKNGNTRAMVEVGYAYEAGMGVAKDEKVALGWYQQAADCDDDTGHCYLASCYECGVGGPVDIEKAKEHYLRAAQLGHPRGMTGYARLIENEDIKTAIQYLTEASDMGYPFAKNMLAYYYEVGKGVPQSYIKAYSLYMQSALMHNPDGLYNVARYCENGLNGEKDIDMAIDFYYHAGLAGEETGFINAGYLCSTKDQPDHKRAFEYYQLAANAGVVEAYGNLGLCYENGHGTKKDPKKAFEAYHQGAVLEDEDCICNVGFCFERGLGVDQSYDIAIKYYKKAIELESARGYSCLANVYEKIGEPEQGMIVDLYTKAIEKGFYKAYRFLGLLYEYGQSVDQDYQKAVEYYELGSAAGDGACSCNLGYLYENGIGVEQNDDQAFHYYELGTMQGNERAYYCLGTCYETNCGVDMDLDEAFYLYEISYEMGYALAALKLGNCYEHGLGVFEDEVKAFRYYKKAVSLDVVPAYYELARAYNYGIGCEIDLKKALRYYKKAVDRGFGLGRIEMAAIYTDLGEGKKAVGQLKLEYEAGNPMAAYYLAQHYRFGDGVGQDYEIALDLLKAALDHGVIEAALSMGLIYERDFENYEQAAIYYQKALSKTNPSSYNNLGVLYQSGLGVQKNYKKAFHLFKQGAELHHPHAMLNLAKCYLYGYGCDQDITKAQDLLKDMMDDPEWSEMDSLAHVLAEAEDLLVQMVLKRRHLK